MPAMNFFSACRTGFARYDQIYSGGQQDNRNKKKKILYRCKHSNLHCVFVGQKNIQSKQNGWAADHEATAFDPRDDHQSDPVSDKFSSKIL
jgi:hypothetical protein